VETALEDAARTWKVQECPCIIEYSTRVLDDIRRAVVDAFYSVPRGGAEIGGILLGRFSGGKISIQDYQALDCEHAKGPSFTLSPTDQAQLARMVTAAAGNGNGLRVVGWYHSHTRSEIFLSQADQDIHQTFFPEQWQVALVLRPHTFEPVRCGFFFREAEGAIRCEASYQEFELEPLTMRPAPAADAAPRQSAAGPLSIPPPARPVHPESEPAGPLITGAAEVGAEPEVPIAHEMELPLTEAEEEASVAIPTPPAKDGHGKTYRVLKTAGWLILALLVLALGILFGTPSFRERGSRIWSAISHPPAQADPTSPVSLGLRAERQNGDLKLTWNRQSAAVLSATSGVLEIGDGNASRKIPLDPSQIRNGSILYAPTTGQIQMQLRVSGPEATTSESVLIILPETGTPQVQILPRKEMRAATNAVSPPNAAQSRLPVKPFTVPAAPRRTETAGSSVALTEPPDVMVKPDAGALAPLTLSQPVVPPLHRAPEQPAPPSQATTTYPQSPAARRSPPVYPPTIISSVPAIYPRALRGFGFATKTVEIKVSVDKAGRIVKVEPILSKEFAPPLMVQAAVEAAWRFRFKAAHIGDQAVPGEMVLRFDFGKL
jgi:proteasome lid subunit RPN8/RPN11